MKAPLKCIKLRRNLLAPAHLLAFSNALLMCIVRKAELTHILLGRIFLTFSFALPTAAEKLAIARESVSNRWPNRAAATTTLTRIGQFNNFPTYAFVHLNGKFSI